MKRKIKKPSRFAIWKAIKQNTPLPKPEIIYKEVDPGFKRYWVLPLVFIILPFLILFLIFCKLENLKNLSLDLEKIINYSDLLTNLFTIFAMIFAMLLSTHIFIKKRKARYEQDKSERNNEIAENLPELLKKFPDVITIKQSDGTIIDSNGTPKYFKKKAEEAHNKSVELSNECDDLTIYK